MKCVTGSGKRDVAALKKLLPAEDILTFEFVTDGGLTFVCVYADAVTDKELLGEQVVKPLLSLRWKSVSDGEAQPAPSSKEQETSTSNETTQSASSEERETSASNKKAPSAPVHKNQKEKYKKGPTVDEVKHKILSPEVRTAAEFSELAQEVLSGNPVLLWDGAKEGLIVGTKQVFVRAIAEPPTDVAIKGPREGFIEDVKVNTSLVRRRFKTEELRIETLTVGRRSRTVVAVCYLEGTSVKSNVDVIKEKLQKIDIDCVPDSSYLTHFLAERPYSLVKQVGTTEKPDIFCAKIAEGRVGILVDGSPIALTLPYLLIEDFQSSEDYFVPSYRASFTRFLRLFALIVAIYLPAFYIAAQLFKLQLFPVKLLLTIAGSIRDIPFSPSIEMLLVCLVLEVLNEASIRMPKYVGMALSVVGALVLGETAVSAGFVSTPAIIIIAFSGIGLYAVPNLIEVTSVLRLAMLLVAGSVGTYGILLLTGFVLHYLVTCESLGVPLLAPFSPMIGKDLRDSLVKFDLGSLPTRPKVLKSPNRRRLK